MHKAESQENVFIYWKLKHNISQPNIVIVIKDQFDLKTARVKTEEEEREQEQEVNENLLFKIILIVARKELPKNKYCMQQVNFQRCLQCTAELKRAGGRPLNTFQNDLDFSFNRFDKVGYRLS